MPHWSSTTGLTASTAILRYGFWLSRIAKERCVNSILQEACLRYLDLFSQQWERKLLPVLSIVDPVGMSIVDPVGMPIVDPVGMPIVDPVGMPAVRTQAVTSVVNCGSSAILGGSIPSQTPHVMIGTMSYNSPLQKTWRCEDTVNTHTWFKIHLQPLYSCRN
jgi:hypothetical protein